MAICVVLGVLLNYADDSSTMISAPTNELLSLEARGCAVLMAEYCAHNFLTLNGLKSVIMCFRNSQQSSPYVPLNGKSVLSFF